MSVDALGRILGFALRGAGATRLVTTVAAMESVIVTIMWRNGFWSQTSASTAAPAT